MQSISTFVQSCLPLFGVLVSLNGLSAAPSPDRERLLRTYVTQLNTSPLPQNLTMQQRILIAIPLVYRGVSQQEFLSDVPSFLRQSYFLTTYRLTSDTSYIWSGTEWENDSRNSYTYCGNRLTKFVAQYWDIDSVKWLNAYDTYYWYDGSGRLTSTRFRSWQNGAWLNADSTTFTYDENGYVDVRITRKWAADQWVNWWRETFSYSGGRISHLLTELWEGAAWVNGARETYIYDGNGNLTQWLSQLWQLTEWVNSTRYMYTYDVQNREIESTIETWETGVWVNNSRTTSTYDVSGSPEINVHYIWETTAWVPQEADTFKYFGNQLIQEVRWDIPTDDLFRYDYTYDVNGNNILILGYADYLGTGWESTTREVFVYQAQPSWLCGDANASGFVNIADIIYLVAYIFTGGPPPNPEAAVGDVNCNGQVNLADAVYIVQYIFNGGPAPCPP